MFWNKNKESIGKDTRVDRQARVVISAKFEEILFIPMGKVDNSHWTELKEIKVGKWPMNLDELHQNIVDVMSNYLPNYKPIDDEIKNWPAFKTSKSKSQISYKRDYVHICLKTDTDANYFSENSSDFVIIEAQPFYQSDNHYTIRGRWSLNEEKIAEILLSIFNACETLRIN